MITWFPKLYGKVSKQLLERMATAWFHSDRLVIVAVKVCCKFAGALSLSYCLLQFVRGVQAFLRTFPLFNFREEEVPQLEGLSHVLRRVC